VSDVDRRTPLAAYGGRNPDPSLATSGGRHPDAPGLHSGPGALPLLRALEGAHLTRAYARLPVAFVRGEGARLWDAQGVEYLDFQTGLAVTSCGHSHPAVVEAIRAQAARLVHTGNLVFTEPQLRRGLMLAAELAPDHPEGAPAIGQSDHDPGRDVSGRQRPDDQR
jgi:4-aminobutyrate aminotransferase-like enzyme